MSEPVEQSLFTSRIQDVKDLLKSDPLAYDDFIMRARGGIVIYIAVWLLTAIWVDMPEKTPLFFYSNLFIFGFIVLARSSHYLIFGINPDYKPISMYYCLVGLILFGALHWGVMSAWVIFWSPYTELHYPYMILLASFAMGGTIVLSISYITTVFYPLLIFVPTIVAGQVVGGSDEYTVLGLLAVFSVIYVYEASRVSRKDYWSAITSHKKSEERALEMEKLSITDQLTGLYNRQYFAKKFDEEWSRCRRLNIPLTLLVIDVDKFKSINDKYGHISGDKCLKEIATALKTHVQRITDTVVRYGGEEFVILLPNTDQNMASNIASSLLKTVRDITPIWGGESSSVSCSIGLGTVIPNAFMTGEKFIKVTDDALYRAKREGRNRYCIAEAP